jgi:hypothetical protein
VLAGDGTRFLGLRSCGPIAVSTSIISRFGLRLGGSSTGRAVAGTVVGSIIPSITLTGWRVYCGPAPERVRRTHPAAYLKILALLVPREHKVQHSNPIKDLTDEQLEAMIEYIKTSLEAQAGGSGTAVHSIAGGDASRPDRRQGLGENLPKLSVAHAAVDSLHQPG